MAAAIGINETRLRASEQMEKLDWSALEESLWAYGYAVTPLLLTPEQCSGLIGIYGDERKFRSHIVMERYRFGVGDYKYFENPLPELVAELRSSAYPHLAGIANRWSEALGEDSALYPQEHSEFLKICHKAGQKRPTPLMLRYATGGYNCLHQDIYGEVSFPMQMVYLLGQQGRDWQGGEFILVEQRPRAQSKAEVVPANQGHAIIFTTRHRPVKGARGHYRVGLKHGVSRVKSGTRHTLGIIFHDAK